ASVLLLSREIAILQHESERLYSPFLKKLSALAKCFSDFDFLFEHETAPKNKINMIIGNLIIN
ncbi:MAG TPA: hypothetical protein VI548_11900, partial [Chitinophagaceae bacterium]|nr:hypothetical protein [Chitinophagaceae bacterium]